MMTHESLETDTGPYEDANPEADKLKPQRRLAVKRSENPVPIYMPKGKVGIAWVFDIVYAYDPPESPLTDWWNYATRMYPAEQPEEVFLKPLMKNPPDATLTFNVYTAGTDKNARERLEHVIGNVLVLSNVQVDPVPALRLIHPGPPDAPPLPDEQPVDGAPLPDLPPQPVNRF